MYLIFLGHQPDLSVLEIEAVLGQKPSLIAPQVASIEAHDSLLQLADKLGGSTKIAKVIESVDEKNLIPHLTSLLRESLAKNVAVSNYSNSSLSEHDLHSIKEEIAKDRSIRFVSFQTSGHELLMLKKKHVDELNIVESEGKLILARTVWIYDGLGFASRDRKRPYQDIKRGMLPLKVARAMVNLATRGQGGLTVYDPFCGTGTILMEAMSVGNNVVGSDNDQNAVQGTTTNLSWLSAKKLGGRGEFSIFQAEVTNPGELKVDCIATEPYMGPLIDSKKRFPEEKLHNIARGLDKLYRGAFRAWHKILPVGGRVVITIPEFRLGDRTISTISIDTTRALGYNYVSSVAYSKPGATVIRRITILEKT